VLNDDQFNIIDVSFTLDDDFVMTYATFGARSWIHPTQNPATGLWSVPQGAQYQAMDLYTVVQKTEREEGEAVPTNPYSLDDFLISSYDMVKDGQTLEEGELLEINANQLLTVNLQNVQPETFNLNFDELTVTLTDSDGNVKDCVTDVNKLVDGEIMAQVLSLNKYDGETVTTKNVIQFKSLLAGEFTLTIKSAKLTKTLKLKVNTIVPSEFGANVYEFNAMNSTWEVDNYNSEFTVYAGQGLNFNSYVAHPFYEEKGFTCTVIRGLDSDIDADYTITDSTVNGVSVKKFVATVTGDYTITLVNAKSDSKTFMLTVHVVEAPDIADLIQGKYFNLDKKVELTFEPTEEGGTSGTATLVTGVGSKYTQKETVLSYSYTEGEGVTLEYVSGVKYNNNEYEFNLTFDDAYNMTVSYKAATGLFTNVYLYNTIPNLIVGTYRITSDSSTAVSQVVNIDGTYEISANGPGVWYCVYDVKTERPVGENIQLNAKEENKYVQLTVGQYLKVWCIGSASTTVTPATEYTITYLPEGIPEEPEENPEESTETSEAE
ncbi:MAG: hypothetical protein K2N14_02575, partial [Clostridia bacterium]|nr:hypothetical protein [Clostridia bacterium]